MSAEYNTQPISGETKYVDYDEPTAMWCIFGADSGFAYGSFASEEDAEKTLKEEQGQKA